MRAIQAPIVVAIASVSGGGKTTAVKLLAEHLPNTKALYFDDYDFDGPENIMEWLNNGTDYNEWNLSPLLTELEALKLEPLEWILMDFPFADQHTASKKYIDMTVFIDTPLDLALSRRLMRDFTSATKAEVMEDVQFYATAGRAAYLQMLNDILPNSDIVIDGSKSKEDVFNAIALELRKRKI